eukprot:COSAG01_NODE_69049_length_262_cov_0.957055_1_plen_43_part_01
MSGISHFEALAVLAVAISPLRLRVVVVGLGAACSSVGLPRCVR